ncbi:MAG: hypothetical protein AB2A00_19015 [Myxococcota bacterium]
MVNVVKQGITLEFLDAVHAARWLHPYAGMPDAAALLAAANEFRAKFLK